MELDKTIRANTQPQIAFLCMSWSFFREFIFNWKSVGAVAPSSPMLASLLAESANISAARKVLELGPGTGPITAAISNTIPAQAHYLGLEMNESFVKQLRERFPAMQFEAVAAQTFDFDQVLGRDGSFDAIVSGLPWTAFPESLQIAILDHVMARLRPGGLFVTFAYAGFHMLPSGRHFRKLLSSRVATLETTHTIWGNFPPAFVYVAKMGSAENGTGQADTEA